MNNPGHRNDRAAALTALSPDQKKKLTAYARFMANGDADRAEELLQGAFLRWMGSAKPIEGPEQTCKFLRDAINSIRSNGFRHDRVIRRVEGVRMFAQDDDEVDPVELAADPAVTIEAAVYFQQVYDLCAPDQEIQLLLLAQLAGDTPAQIQAELGWDDKKIKAVQTRKKRLVMKWTLEGKLR